MLRSPEGRRRRRASTIVALVLCLVLGWHFLATYTWSAKPNAVRDLIGQDTLSAYMLPLFDQNWYVFAPNPLSVNRQLAVRAKVRSPEGDLTTTPWLSLTDHSWRTGILRHPVPSRLYLNDYQLAGRFYGAAMALDAEVRDVAGGTYVEAGWPGRLKADLLEAVGRAHDSRVDDFMAYERAATALASAVARARWGDGAVRVQVRTQQTTVPPFAQRSNPDASTTTNWFIDGWRRVTIPEGLDLGIFRRWYAKGGDA